jgi:hypothetical protein
MQYLHVGNVQSVAVIPALLLTANRILKYDNSKCTKNCSKHSTALTIPLFWQLNSHKSRVFLLHHKIMATFQRFKISGASKQVATGWMQRQIRRSRNNQPIACVRVHCIKLRIEYQFAPSNGQHWINTQREIEVA